MFAQVRVNAKIQFRPAGFIAFSLDEGLPAHRCSAAFRFPSGKVVTHRGLSVSIRQGVPNRGLPGAVPQGVPNRCFPVAIRQGGDTSRLIGFHPEW